MSAQVKSKQRVAEHGEVFTAEREIKAMCDLVNRETERIDSRFLEPACGDGNFLYEILSRKLVVVKKKYSRSPLDYEKNAILALSSVYGVDILQDNAIACRERLFAIWDKEYKSVCKKECRDDTRGVARFILSRNIVCGNALTLMCVDENGNDTSEPIVFSEWAFITGTQMQRKDYTFDELLNGDDKACKKKTKKEQLTLFDEPQPDEGGKFLKQYISDYRRVQDNG
ncbi:restriction endonuclease subunit M [Dehalococcoides sp. THU3]|uniref:restriction endonuclease subunit M n=1 Tax=Dehalococcoides TaxID=61434 RepID=UPI0032183A39